MLYAITTCNKMYSPHKKKFYRRKFWFLMKAKQALGDYKSRINILINHIICEIIQNVVQRKIKKETK